MTILVDSALWRWRDRWWCHLVSDTSLDELHKFADHLGLPDRAFGGDHYDIPQEIRAQAIAAGAREVTCKELVTALYRAGIRTPPRITSPN